MKILHLLKYFAVIVMLLMLVASFKWGYFDFIIYKFAVIQQSNATMAFFAFILFLVSLEETDLRLLKK